MTSDQNRALLSASIPSGIPQTERRPEESRNANWSTSNALPDQNGSIENAAGGGSSSIPSPGDSIIATANPVTATIASQLRRLRFSGSTAQVTSNAATRVKSSASDSLSVSATGFSLIRLGWVLSYKRTFCFCTHECNTYCIVLARVLYFGLYGSVVLEDLSRNIS